MSHDFDLRVSTTVDDTSPETMLRTNLEAWANDINTETAFPALCATISARSIDPNNFYQLRPGKEKDSVLSFLARQPVAGSPEGQRLFMQRVQTLVDLGADPDHALENGFAPLHIAAASGQTDLIQALLDKKASVNNRDTGHQLTPLHIAAISGQSAAVQVLLERGADRHLTMDSGWQPLHLAAQQGHTGIVDLLLREPADLESTTAGHWQNGHLRPAFALTPLHIACMNGQIEVIEHLLARGADIDARTAAGELSIHLAAVHNQPAVIQTLVARHAYLLNMPNAIGYTPIHCAASSNALLAIKQLIELGAIVESRGRYGETPLHVACSGAHLPAVLALLGQGVDPDASANSGATPLHIAIITDQIDIVRALLTAGANPYACNAFGKTAIESAIDRSTKSIWMLLINTQMQRRIDQ